MEILYIVQKTAKTYATNKIEIKDNMLSRCGHTKGRRLSSIKYHRGIIKLMKGSCHGTLKSPPPIFPAHGIEKLICVGWETGVVIDKDGTDSLFMVVFFLYNETRRDDFLVKKKPWNPLVPELPSAFLFALSCSEYLFRLSLNLVRTFLANLQFQYNGGKLSIAV